MQAAPDYAYNKIDTTRPKRRVIATMVRYGLIVHVQCAERVKHTTKLILSKKSFKISITQDIAETLWNLLSEEPYAVIDLKSTELYKNAQTWKNLALTRPIQKQMWLIIQRSSSNEFIEDIDARTKIKEGLKVWGLVLTSMVLVTFPLLIAAARTPTVTAGFKWEKIFNLEPAPLTTKHMLTRRR